MAKATLELVIVDSGPAPIGGAAPAGYAPQFARADMAATAPGGQTARAGSATEAVGDVAKAMAINKVADTVQQTGDALEKLSNAAKRSAAAQETVAGMFERTRALSITAPVIAPPFTAPEGASEMVEGAAAMRISAVSAAAAITAFAAAATAGALTVKKASDTLHSESELAASYSPEVAQATALSQIREIQNEMRRVQRIGPSLAASERATSDFESKTSDLWTEVLKLLSRAWQAIEPLAGAGIELLTSILEGINALVESVGKIIQMGPDKDQVKKDMEFIEQWRERQRKLERAQQQDRHIADPFGESFDNLFPGRRLFGPAPRPVKQPLGV